MYTMRESCYWINMIQPHKSKSPQADLVAQGVKQCFTCKEIKSLDEFHKTNNRSVAGRVPDCRICRQDRRKTEYQTNVVVRERKKKHTRDAWHALSRVEKFAVNIRRKFKLSYEEYEKILAEQGGACAICRSSSPGNPRIAFFVVDHCHETGKIRGLLCHPCNVGLGYFKDNVDTIKSTLLYLEQ